MDSAQYHAAVAARLQESGYTLQPSAPGTLVGYRKDFKLRWMASTLHLFVHVATTPHVSTTDLTSYTQAALQHAKDAKGAMRGAQSGVAAVVAAVGDHADEDAHAFARKKVVRGYAAFAWPVVVDLGTGTRTSQSGRPMVGAVFNPWMRRQIDTVLPVPSEL